MARKSRCRLDAAESPVHGTGVFTRDPVAAGAFIAAFEGTPTDTDGAHVLWIADDQGAWHGIDGTTTLRWLNHSAEPNAEFDGADLYAIRDVAAGDELLIDYGPDWSA